MAQSKAVGWKTVVVALMAVPVMIGFLMWKDKPPSRAEIVADTAVRADIRTAFGSQGLPAPQIAIQNKRLVADFELGDPELALLANAGFKTPRQFGEKAVLTIRNTALKSGVARIYRVNVNGPSPGPGLITRIGSAVFIEGGRLEWEYGFSK